MSKTALRILLISLFIANSSMVYAKDYFDFTIAEFKERIATLMDKDESILIIPDLKCPPIRSGIFRKCEAKLSENLALKIVETEKDGDANNGVFIQGAPGDVYEVSATLDLLNQSKNDEGEIFDKVCVGMLAVARGKSLGYAVDLYGRLFRSLANRSNMIDVIQKDDKDKKTMTVFSVSFHRIEAKCSISADMANFQ